MPCADKTARVSFSVGSVYLGKGEENGYTLGCWTSNEGREWNPEWGAKVEITLASQDSVLHPCLCSTAWVVGWSLLNSVLGQFSSLELVICHFSWKMTDSFLEKFLKCDVWCFVVCGGLFVFNVLLQTIKQILTFCVSWTNFFLNCYHFCAAQTFSTCIGVFAMSVSPEYFPVVFGRALPLLTWLWQELFFCRPEALLWWESIIPWHVCFLLWLMFTSQSTVVIIVISNLPAVMPAS